MQQLNKRTSQTVSQKIHEQILEKADATILDDSDDGDSRPKISEFDENEELASTLSKTTLSNVRKANIQYLDTIDKKYQGQVSSRREIFDESSSSSAETEEHMPGAFVRLKPPESNDSDQLSIEQDSSASDENSDSEDAFDDDDFSLGDFLQKDTNTQKLLQEENNQESVEKGMCVQNQLKIWERLLEIRIKMQPSLVTANSLPNELQFSEFMKDKRFDEATYKTVGLIEATLKNLLELQHNLAARFQETKNLFNSGLKRKGLENNSCYKGKVPRLDDYEITIDSNFNTFKPYRNDVIQKWHDRAKLSTNIKNANQSMSIIKKIENSMLAKEELIKKTQLYRGGYALFNRPTQSERFKTDISVDETPDSIYDEEIFDDSDFYHSLLRELIEFKSNSTVNSQEVNAKLAELQKLRSKMKKQVDTRASKGRKIRYIVHKKLVNFTAPDDNYEWTNEAKNELFSSLFGAAGLTEK